LDFRNGHSIYLAFVLSFINFILIVYNLGISSIPVLNQALSNVWVFAAIFIFVYIPAAILIGYWHRKKQYSVENEAWLQENWIWAWISSYQIRLIEGKATPEETKQVKEYLEAILKKQNKEFLIGSKDKSEI
jgi:hypothetical protein